MQNHNNPNPSRCSGHQRSEEDSHDDTKHQETLSLASVRANLSYDKNVSTC